MLEFTLSEDKTYYIVMRTTDRVSTTGEIPAEYNGLPVKEIGKRAFFWCENLEKITIPNSITKIGDEAFYNCFSLTSVVMPNSLTSIGAKAFQNCRSLTSVVMPNSVISIGAQAFQDCRSLTAIVLPKKIEELSECLFDGCSSLTEVKIPNGVTTINEKAFRSCINLTTVKIPEGVTSIGCQAFAACPKLASITIPKGVTSICKQVFENCGFTSVAIPDSVTSIDFYAFHNCKNLTEITISNNLNDFDEKAFNACPISKVNFLGMIDEWAQRGFGKAFEHGYDLYLNDNLVTDAIILTFKIAKGAFYNCTSLKRVTLVYGLDVLVDEVFKNCCNLVDVNLPDTLKRISPSALLGCDKLNYAKYHNGCYLGNKNNKYTILVKPDNKDINYSIINPATKFINDSAFLDCKRLESVGVEENSQLTEIGDFAFSGCINLKTANFEPAEQLTNMGFRAFKDCGLTSFSIPEGIKKINAWAFEKCSKVTRLKIPTSLQVIEAGTFYDCDLDEVDFVNYVGWQVEIPKEGKDPKIKKINKKLLMDKVKAAGVLTEYSHAKWINTVDFSKMKKF